MFLDGCLHMFFEKFNAIFPLIHRPTFVFSDWTYTLLLNAIAIGSLFMGGARDIAKGEFLWRLAHVAVATSWQTLINHRGPYDACHGIQLVLTALLGQIYATLSESKSLRKTARIFHSLGFYWARECGMYNSIDPAEVTPWAGVPTDDEIQLKWNEWAASETRLRALLGHYILDGQISQNTGFPPCERHAANPLRLPSADAIFNAQTARLWSREVESAPSPKNNNFASLFPDLFSRQDRRFSTIQVSPLAARVLLEAMKCLVSEAGMGSQNIVGAVSKMDISYAMAQLYHQIAYSEDIRAAGKADALMRWHLIAIDIVADSNQILRSLCLSDGTRQKLFDAGCQGGSVIDLRAWCGGSAARRALLHSMAIHAALQNLPISQLRSIHVPGSIFAASAVYYGFISAGYVQLPVPDIPDWKALMLVVSSESPGGAARLPRSERVFPDLLQYLDVSGATADLKDLSWPSRNLLYDFYSLSNHLKNLASGPWGISKHMVSIVDEWIACCDLRF